MKYKKEIIRRKRFPKGISKMIFPMFMPFGAFDPRQLLLESRQKFADKIPATAKTKLVIEIEHFNGIVEFIAYK